jgi:hypothetical protein
MSIDPKNLALPDGLRPLLSHSEESRLSVKSCRAYVEGRFIKGPIPLLWLSRAGMLPGKALHVAIAICFLTGVKKMNTVPVSNKLLAEFGVNRYAKSRALKQLSDAGLVSVEQGVGRSPVVTVLEWNNAG